MHRSAIHRILPGQIAFCRSLLLSITCIIVTLPLAALAANERLHLVTMMPPPYSSNDGKTGFLELLAEQAFKRINIDVQVNKLTAERALVNVNMGFDDGDLYRTPGFEHNYPNLVRVPELINQIDLFAYTALTDIKISGWSDLDQYSVAYVIGQKIFERKVTAKNIISVTDLNELALVVQNHSVQIILHPGCQSQRLFKNKGLQLQRHLLERVNVYMYLHKKHQSIIPQLTKALVDMKKDGSFEKIRQDTLVSAFANDC